MHHHLVIPHSQMQCDAGQKEGTWLQLSLHQPSRPELALGPTERHLPPAVAGGGVRVVVLVMGLRRQKVLNDNMP
jgi:hypothetical protein